MNKENLLVNQNKGQEWWEISRNPDPKKAFWEEMNEVLEKARWFRKSFWNTPNARANSNWWTSQEDIDKFWKKWRDGGHFWHPEKKRWYLEKWKTKKNQ